VLFLPAIKPGGGFLKGEIKGGLWGMEIWGAAVFVADLLSVQFLLIWEFRGLDGFCDAENSQKNVGMGVPGVRKL
jgi:hypothetical protein